MKSWIFSKIKVGQLAIVFEPFALRTMMAQTMKALALRAEAKKIRLAWQLPDSTSSLSLGLHKADCSRHRRQRLVNSMFSPPPHQSSGFCWLRTLHQTAR